MNFIEKAFKELWPEKELGHEVAVNYSGKFSDYNANVSYTPFSLKFKLSRKWRGVDEDIKIGLIQSLLIKVFKDKDYEKNNKIEFYNMFLKNVALVAPRKESPPELIESFERVNNSYFYGLIDMPNLKWGRDSVRKLGSYEYGSDKLIISSLLKKAPSHLLDYVMYHELLHKKHKFYHKNGRSYHHTRVFKKDEKRFENAEIADKELKGFMSKKRWKKFFWF